MDDNSFNIMVSDNCSPINSIESPFKMNSSIISKSSFISATDSDSIKSSASFWFISSKDNISDLFTSVTFSICKVSSSSTI